MIAELGHQHMSQKAGTAKATLDGPGWRGCFHHAVTTAACKLRPYMADDLEALGDVLQLLGHILAELAQCSAATGTAIVLRKMCDDLAEKMLGQRLARRSRLDFGSRCNGFDGRLHLSLRGLQLFQMEFELFELNDNLLALPAKHRAPQLLDRQLQMLDLLAART